jgi:hypothetical protein
MLDFICELERVMTKWPENVSWTIAQVADYTSTSVPQVVDILSDVLDREIEVHEVVTAAEGARALATLRERMADQLAEREKQQLARRDKAMRSYDVTMEKVRILSGDKSWRNAYKTLSYYVGCHEKDLPDDVLLSLCGECLRLGFKAQANIQELTQWLRKGIAACLKAGTPEATYAAIDFIDAYGESFVEGEGLRGKKLVGNVLESVRPQAETFNLTPQYDSLLKELCLS